MIDAAVRKAHIGWNIRQNPTEVTIRVIQKVKSGGGFEEVKSQIGPLTVRIFVESRERAEIVSEQAGRKEVSDSYSLLADYTANLPSGPDVTQEFEAYPHGKFRITSVHPQIVQNEVCGYVCDLERTK
ncbi:MAG: Fe-S protein [Paenibacillus macerans]|uniref:Fe-S protein n=1 Tax=Paenibacillus macerans TaxID=44252 RepID=UPI001F0FDE64|nr:Fe-S protein [Paenibacillus macerans]MDU5945457.1 Fe-S protein [Paenibacillus macerans]MDU7473620.1 Fe-S protein [Paenibacillus macerans]MEC0139204.1 Fe-S protein [Paenibacillus macerans]UMV47285.1 Fe-S protein [Paenibacillus macerans]